MSLLRESIKSLAETFERQREADFAAARILESDLADTLTCIELLKDFVLQLEFDETAGRYAVIEGGGNCGISIVRMNVDLAAQRNVDRHLDHEFERPALHRLIDGDA